MKRCPVLAIDGPAGTGKTTSAREVARRLGFAYVDSGALYRAVAVAARARGVAGPDDPGLVRLLEGLLLRAETGSGRFRVFVGEQEVTDRLRGPEVTSLASKLAVHPGVRGKVCECLHALAATGPAVIEGRDIGTAVFPDAELKIYLMATVEERARRRARELENQGITVDLDEVRRQIVERDERDTRRPIAPLRLALGAVEVDTTATDIEGQVTAILETWADRFPPRIRTGYRLHQLLFRAMGRFFWGMRVAGIGNVPRAGGILLVANHKSYLDPLLVGSVLPREICYLAKRELFGMPLVGRWVRSHNAIPIERDRFDRVAIERCLVVIRGGGAVLVFPEGTRILRPGLGQPREGVAWIAARSAVPVVPVHIRGSWARDRRWFRSGGIRIRIGDPLRLPPLPRGREGRMHYPEIAARIMEAIAGLAGG